MKNILILTFLAFSFLSCERSPYSYKDFEGDWKLEDILEEGEEDYSHFEIFSPRVGLSFKDNSVENFNGYFDQINDSTFNYVGNFSTYKLKGNKLIFNRGLFKKEPMEWEITKVTKDTIYLKDVDDRFYLRRININTSPKNEFDQIIYSTSGCYGSCPIQDISIERNGNFYFFGEGYVKNTGVFKGHSNEELTSYVFQKFNNVNPLKLEEEYYSSTTDLFETTLTFIKNEKIIKTIVEYGYEKAPDELIWSYVPISNLPDQIKLNEIRSESPPLPDLEFFVFVNNNSILELKKSEGFYLWTEIKSHSKTTNDKFIEKYNIRFIENFIYWGPRPKGSKKSNVKSIISDGQYFKFGMKDGTSITYDLGYNFVERNFSESDFVLNDSNTLNKILK